MKLAVVGFPPRCFGKSRLSTGGYGGGLGYRSSALSNLYAQDHALGHISS